MQNLQPNHDPNEDQNNSAYEQRSGNSTNHEFKSNQNSSNQPQGLYYQPQNVEKKRGFWGYFLTAAISIFLTAAVFVTIFAVLFNNRLVPGQSPEQLESNKGYGLDFEDTAENQQALEKLDTVTKLLEENYYQDLSEKELIDAMTSGLLDAMESPYTFYMDQEYVKDMEESMSGSYSGIGATIEQIGTNFQVSDLVADSPAERSGLLINDVFMKVNGKSANEYEDVTALAIDIRGEEGTTVNIVVYRPSENKEYTFDIERKTITNSNIHYQMLTDQIGYIRITEFNTGVSDNFIAAIKALQEEGAKDLVFDLRNNGGGYVHEVLAMLDYLLPEGRLITEVGRRDGKPFEIEQTSEASMGVDKSMNFICLMNSNSASASELFAGCLRDWQKAKLVGETSFGKGVGTITKYLSDGSAIQITNFHYNLPNGENIDQVGLEPDYPVELPEDLKNVIVSRIEKDQDTQLQKAIEVLENER